MIGKLADAADESARRVAGRYARRAFGRAAARVTAIVNPRHLYVHVPFCRAKCDYCEFYSVPTRCGPGAVVGGKQTPAGCDDARLSRYVDALLAELQLVRKGAKQNSGRLQTVFFGGGTPSLLGEVRLEQLLSALDQQLTPRAEVSVETNPEDVTPEYAEWAARRGVRVSLGVQSFSARWRGVLGRRAAADPAVAYRRLRAAGVANVGVDLIFGIPGQGRGDLEAELGQVARLRPDHVSWYELDAPRGTPLAARLAAGEAALPDEDECAAQFRVIVRGLSRLGYRWYEVSNFALPGRRCRHNSAVWRGEDYLGLGPAAVSTLGEVRRRNLPDLAAYLDALAPRGEPVPAPGDGSLAPVPGDRGPVAPPRAVEHLSAATRAFERLLLAARTGAALPLSELGDALDGQAVMTLGQAGFVREAGGTLRVTRKGRYVANAVCVRLFRDSYVKGMA
jgi:oxygen-independent coproporphyrinogen-3 oxidase